MVNASTPTPAAAIMPMYWTTVVAISEGLKSTLLTSFLDLHGSSLPIVPRAYAEDS
jgi:hypothetical protein